MSTSIASVLSCLGKSATGASLLHDFMQYPTWPLSFDSDSGLSVVEHLNFYSKPQLHVSMVLYRYDSWALGSLSLSVVARLVLGVRRIYAAAAKGGFTLGRVEYLQIPSAAAAEDGLANVPGDKQVGEITYLYHGKRSERQNVEGSARDVDWFELFVFESWVITDAGLSPFNACSDYFAGPVFLHETVHWYRRPTMSLKVGGPAGVAAWLKNAKDIIPLRIRTMAHEIGHFVAWGMHARSIYQGEGLMSQSIDSLSTEIDEDLADDFLDSCMMNLDCEAAQADAQPDALVTAAQSGIAAVLLPFG